MSCFVLAIRPRRWHGATQHAAIAEARRIAHAPSLVVSLSIGARVLSLVGDNAALDERANELIGMAGEQGFPFWLAQGTTHHGWAKVNNGDTAAGIWLLRAGSSAFRAAGAELM